MTNAVESGWQRWQDWRSAQMKDLRRERPPQQTTSHRIPVSRTALCRGQNPLPFLFLPTPQRCPSRSAGSQRHLSAEPNHILPAGVLQPKGDCGAAAKTAKIWKGTELTLPHPAGWPRAPERFLGGSGCSRKGHAEHGVETGAPRHEPADRDTAGIRYSVEEGHPTAAYRPGKAYFRDK